MKLFNMAIVASALALSACSGWNMSDFVNGTPTPNDYPYGICGYDVSEGEPTEFIGKDGVTVYQNDQAPVETPIPCKPPVNDPECKVDCVPVVDPECIVGCDPVKVLGGNPGNGFAVGNSPWDGITGNSHKNDVNGTSPNSKPMDGQRDDQPHPQPGGKGNNASNANK